jgi:hypothetical protein
MATLTGTEQKILLETAGKLERAAEALRYAAWNANAKTAEEGQRWLRHLPSADTQQYMRDALLRVERG